jgi:hypothetical protein
MTSTTTTVKFIVTRDTARATATDEDRAMAHAQHYSGDDLSAAQTALYCVLQAEATWLSEASYRSARSLRKAADMLDAADHVHTLIPETGKPWASARIETAGILWQIVRIERPAD